VACGRTGAVAAAVDEDLREPGRGRRGMLEPVEAAVRLEEAILHRVLRLVADESPREVVEARKFALSQLAKGRFVLGRTMVVH